MFAIGARARRRYGTGLLYSRIVEQARQPEFYSRLLVPDTIEGRFELVILHCALVLRRLGQIGGTAGKFGQELLEYMLDDLDRSIREIGVGDMVVGKYMKRLGKSFYGRAAAYDAALAANDMDALAAALGRNVLGTAEAPDAARDLAARDLATYVRDLAAKLDTCDLTAIQAARFHLAPTYKDAA